VPKTGPNSSGKISRPKKGRGKMRGGRSGKHIMADPLLEVAAGQTGEAAEADLASGHS
jgi:hypothetical protein